MNGDDNAEDLSDRILTVMETALGQAQKLIEDGWLYHPERAIIYHQGEEGSSERIDPVVWMMMKAISTGMAMRQPSR